MEVLERPCGTGGRGEREKPLKAGDLSRCRDVAGRGEAKASRGLKLVSCEWSGESRVDVSISTVRKETKRGEKRGNTQEKERRRKEQGKGGKGKGKEACRRKEACATPLLELEKPALRDVPGN